MSERLTESAPDEVTLGCPKCPRRLVTRRRRRSVYHRVTPWAGSIARYQCEGCGFEHPFTAEWVRDLSSSPGRQATP